ncbi:MAG TPA: DNA-3-methyladenine glycosylase [Bryobacteraceae bacterium]|jgi:DNA-3-methyladenine glycosylase II|nr:DNA-3-methyladenine glycosylase [Bryobacteraceae bacterium]
MSPQTLRKAAVHLKQGDSRLAAVVERVGPCRIKFADPTFPELVRAIVYQQLNGKAAASIHARFEAACGRSGVTPKSILRLDVDGLRANGISPQKASYMLDLAAHTAAKRLNFSRLPRLADEDVIAQLTQVKGVGVWTAHMFLMFSLRRPNILPVGDYGVRAAVQKLYGLPEMPKPPEMERIAAPWAPWCTVASWYLWRSLEPGNMPEE